MVLLLSLFLVAYHGFRKIYAFFSKSELIRLLEEVDWSRFCTFSGKCQKIKKKGALINRPPAASKVEQPPAARDLQLTPGAFFRTMAKPQFTALCLNFSRLNLTPFFLATRAYSCSFDRFRAETSAFEFFEKFKSVSLGFENDHFQGKNYFSKIGFSSNCSKSGKCKVKTEKWIPTSNFHKKPLFPAWL